MYNFEGYFGKKKTEDDLDKPLGPATNEFNIKKWMWLLMVDKICKELNMVPDSVYKMNYISALNWLSMWSERDKHIRELNK